jgi:hypothetical protein
VIIEILLASYIVVVAIQKGMFCRHVARFSGYASDTSNTFGHKSEHRWS